MARRRQLDLEKDAPKIGHNSNLDNDARSKLSAFVGRIEGLEEEKAVIAGDIKNVYDEADSDGFDKKTIRAVIRLRKLDKHEREEQQAMIETYMRALGMLADTPLGQAAIAKAAANA